MQLILLITVNIYQLFVYLQQNMHEKYCYENSLVLLKAIANWILIFNFSAANGIKFLHFCLYCLLVCLNVCENIKNQNQNFAHLLFESFDFDHLEI